MEVCSGGEEEEEEEDSGRHLHLGPQKFVDCLSGYMLKNHIRSFKDPEKGKVCSDYRL